jgi:hypothetical protein
MNVLSQFTAARLSSWRVISLRLGWDNVSIDKPGGMVGLCLPWGSRQKWDFNLRGRRLAMFLAVGTHIFIYVCVN